MSFVSSTRVSSLFALMAVSVISLAANMSYSQVCPFDDGNSTLAVEGLILTRYALGITGAPLVASTGINTVDAPTVEAAINCPSCGLNITGNPTLTVADATIISRKLAGFSGDALTNGVALGSGTRSTPAAVQSFLLSGCGATGGTVTSITAGSGLTGGTITGSGTIAVNTSVIQNRVSGTCAVGSSIRAIAVDGTVTCQTDTTGGSGTVTNVATGAGLTGGPVTTSGTIGLAATQLLPTTACANNQIPKWNGSAWLCATEAVGGTGTVTNVASGTGLSGGPITASGTLSIANPFRLPQSCVDGQIAKYNSNTQLWECATDNGGGGTVTSVGAGIGINGGPVTTSGTLAIAPSFRLPQTCASGQFTRFNNTLNLWECVTPAVVTNVGTGPGLTGGPITATGTVGLATTQLLPTTACATDQIIKWNGTAWVCASSTLALPTTCSIGQVLQLGSSGSIECRSLPSTLTVVDSANDVGLYTSIVVPADGRPVISYQDATNGNLNVMRCGVPSCSIGNTIEVADFVGVVGRDTSIAVSAVAGTPMISYYDITNGDLKVARCTTSACTSFVTYTMDSVGNVGKYTSIFVPADSLPVISYYDATNLDLKVLKCSSISCSAGSTITVVDSLGDVGAYSSLFVPADGLPVISYYDSTNFNLKVAKCGNASCSSGNTLSTVDSTGDVGRDTSIVVPADGLPVISYRDLTNDRVKVLKCGNASCSSGNTVTTLDSTVVTNEGKTSIALSADGLPAISYYDSSNSRLRVAKCGNAVCNAGNTLTMVDGAFGVGTHVSMAIPADGRPVISYYDASNGDLQVVKCSNAACLNP